MKSIEKLRKWLDTENRFWFGRRLEIEPMLNAIETELAERYVALPLDADGEPIHVGDEIQLINGGRDEVRSMTINGAGWLVNERGWWPINLHHHPPTVEDVLEDMIAEAADCDTAELVERYSKLLALRGE